MSRLCMSLLRVKILQTNLQAHNMCLHIMIAIIIFLYYKLLYNSVISKDSELQLVSSAIHTGI